MLTYPNIDPVLFQITDSLAIRWYSLAYVAGLVGGAFYMDWLNKKAPRIANLKAFDDLMVWGIIGVLLGGRLGYVLFYNTGFYLENPMLILQVWQGGMSFHGGLAGVIIAFMLFCRSREIPLLMVGDLAACAAPIGIFFGRLANFINAELYGRVTDAPVGMIFPNTDGLPRHPSQLYEALLEGLFLFVLCLILARKTRIRYYYGALSGIFLCGYGLSRLIVEYFREPDAHLGFIFGSLTMGQLLSLPMIIAGIAFIAYAFKGKHGALK